MSCYVEHDRIQRGRKSIGLCGDWVDERDISGDPDCAECRRLLAETAKDVFGEAAPGTPVHSTLTDPLADYTKRNAR